MKKISKSIATRFNGSIVRIQYDKCWWCGSVANSREHRYKKSDLKSEFGKGPYYAGEAVVRVVDGVSKPVQGPNSNEVKFSNSLCRVCNNSRSQPFDNAYAIFTEYILQNQETIIENGYFEWTKIFSNKWKKGASDTMRYYIKHICCRFAEAGVLVHPKLIKFLNNRVTFLPVNFTMEIRSDIVELLLGLDEKGKGTGALWMGEITCLESRSKGTLSQIESFYGLRWLRINYRYDASIFSRNKVFKTNRVELKKARNLTQEEMVVVFNGIDSDESKE